MAPRDTDNPNGNSTPVKPPTNHIQQRRRVNRCLFGRPDPEATNRWLTSLLSELPKFEDKWQIIEPITTSSTVPQPPPAPTHRDILPRMRLISYNTDRNSLFLKLKKIKQERQMAENLCVEEASLQDSRLQEGSFE